eukprot:PLAT4850.1.p1 GENE.PLAT4850.1~~PLAT4850.1.p1  ORF type:complete len:315 (-),score=66.40 PLAT4850.1:226-1041(-)
MDAIVRRGGRRCPLLICCAEDGFSTGILCLLENGADARARGQHRKTALHYARTEDVVYALLDAGADIEAQAGIDRNTPLLLASDEGRNEAVAALIARGADINAADRNGLTPLMTASREGHAVVVELLLAAGADAARTKWNGGTAEQIAREEGQLEVAAILHSFGAGAGAVAAYPVKSSPAKGKGDSKDDDAAAPVGGDALLLDGSMRIEDFLSGVDATFLAGFAVGFHKQDIHTLRDLMRRKLDHDVAGRAGLSVDAREMIRAALHRVRLA